MFLGIDDDWYPHWYWEIQMAIWIDVTFVWSDENKSLDFTMHVSYLISFSCSAANESLVKMVRLFVIFAVHR
jgi:hypothetical protein